MQINRSSNESMVWYGKLRKWSELWSGGMGEKNTLRWFGHSERMENDTFVRTVYLCENAGPNSGERPPRRWRYRVKEYMCERGATRRGED